MMEVAVLLSLMICSSAEDCRICLGDCSYIEKVELKPDDLLANVRSVMKKIEVWTFFYCVFVFCVTGSCLSKFFYRLVPTFIHFNFEN